MVKIIFIIYLLFTHSQAVLSQGDDNDQPQGDGGQCIGTMSETKELSPFAGAVIKIASSTVYNHEKEICEVTKEVLKKIKIQAVRIDGDKPVGIYKGVILPEISLPPILFGKKNALTNHSLVLRSDSRRIWKDLETVDVFHSIHEKEEEFVSTADRFTVLESDQEGVNGFIFRNKDEIELNDFFSYRSKLLAEMEEAEKANNLIRVKEIQLTLAKGTFLKRESEPSDEFLTSFMNNFRNSSYHRKLTYRVPLRAFGPIDTQVNSPVRFNILSSTREMAQDIYNISDLEIPLNTFCSQMVTLILQQTIVQLILKKLNPKKGHYIVDDIEMVLNYLPNLLRVNSQYVWPKNLTEILQELSRVDDLSTLVEKDCLSL